MRRWRPTLLSRRQACWHCWPQTTSRSTQSKRFSEAEVAWHKGQAEPVSEEEQLKMFALVCFPLMSHDFVKTLGEREPVLSTQRGCQLQLLQFQGAFCGDKPAPRARRVECVYTAPFDGKEALHHIATAGGARAYAYPHDAKLVVASMSSVEVGNPRRFVQDGDNYTSNVAGSWIAVDLQRPLQPTHYCLRSGMPRHKLRN